MKKITQNLRWLVTLLAMIVSVGAWAENVTDVLNQTFTEITETSYTEFSGKTGTSGAVYAGNCAGGNSSIQLRSNNSNSGIVTTTSGGKVKKITVEWNSTTINGRTLNVYGKNTAYEAAADLYNSSKQVQGTLLGTIVKGTSTELTISDDYEYIGLRSNSGAMYLTSVTIEWEPSGTDPLAPSASFGTSSKTLLVEETFTQPVTLKNMADGTPTISYSSGNSAVATVDGDGKVTGKSNGNTTITASVSYNGNNYTASYNVEVLEPKITLSLDKTVIPLEGSAKATAEKENVIEGKTITFSSNNTNVATVDNEGNVSGISTGTATIKASVTLGGTEYSSTVDVEVKEVSLWKKVTSADGLKIDKEYILVYEDTKTNKVFAMGAVTDIGKSEEVSTDGEYVTISPDKDVSVLTLKNGKNADTYAFIINSGNKYLSWSSGNSLNTSTTIDINSSWTLNYDNEGKLSIKNVKDNARKLQYNASSPRFACYTSTQASVSLYVKETVTIDKNTTLAAGKYATRIYPFVPKAIEGIAFYSCKAVNGNALALTPVTELKANTPYILGNDGEGATEAISIKQTGVDIHVNDTYTEGYLTGVFATTTVPEGSYVLQTLNGKQAFYKVEGEFTINTPYRAYLTVPTDVAGNVKAFYLGGDDATAINALDALTSGAYEGIYTVDGVKLSRVEKGVNILKMADGTTRKVIVK